MSPADASIIRSRIEVIDRICVRGRNYFAESGSSHGVDLLEHMENEFHLLKQLVLEMIRDG